MPLKSSLITGICKIQTQFNTTNYLFRTKHSQRLPLRCPCIKISPAETKTNPTQIFSPPLYSCLGTPHEKMVIAAGQSIS